MNTATKLLYRYENPSLLLVDDILFETTYAIDSAVGVKRVRVHALMGYIEVETESHEIREQTAQNIQWLGIDMKREPYSEI